MSDAATIQSPSEILYRRILIAMLADKREQLLSARNAYYHKNRLKILASHKSMLSKSPERRSRKLAYMTAWRKLNPNAKKHWDAQNKPQVSAYNAIRNADPAAIAKKKKSSRLWRVNNPAKVKANKKRWEKENPEKHTEIKRRAEQKEISTKPHVAMRKRLKANIGIYLKRIGGSKANQTCDSLVGCDMRFFAKWIESFFLPGMSFANRSLWHIDHIFPMACCGTNQSETLKAQNYRNFRPLWGADNIKKRCHLSEDSIISGWLCGLTEIHLNGITKVSESVLSSARRLGFSIFKNGEAA